MKKLIEGIQQFKTGYFRSHKELFEQLSHGQSPRILFITCSDSRIDPNLITQAQVGELFVIRNAGNIVPPFGAANGGEGATIEYAVEALGVEEIIVCGHSHCGAMKGLLKTESLGDKMPLVCEWLKHAEATRRLVKENYSDFEGEELLEITVAQNILNQLDNLQTYPVVRSKLHQRKIALHGWIYRIETGEVLAYDPVCHDFSPARVPLAQVEPEYILHPSCPMEHGSGLSVSPSVASTPSKATSNGHAGVAASRSSLPGSYLSPEQSERIYKGSGR